MRVTTFFKVLVGIKRYILILIIGLILFIFGLSGVLQSLQFRTGLLNLLLSELGNAELVTTILILGIFITFYAVYKLIRRFMGYMRDSIYDTNVVPYVAETKILSSRDKFVVIGGGTGIANILRELKTASSNITAVVTVTDEGGSSGKLRNSLNILPPGDIRNCLVSLANDGALLSQLFQYRFKKDELQGHSLGNLLIAGLSDLHGGFANALVDLEKVLAIRGKVYPGTLGKVRLKASYSDGTDVIGEVQIEQTDKRIEKIELVPADVKALQSVLSAISEANYIFLGPGSLYTSIIPNILIKDINAALRLTPAKKIFIANIVTQKYETYNMTMSEHINAIDSLLPFNFIDYIFIHNKDIPPSLLQQYAAEDSFPVILDYDNLKDLHDKIIYGDFVIDSAEYLRHSAKKIIAYLRQQKS